ncbi:hypothetical protein BLNAU_1248 [Blattamonas nauphoetae]|uniref:Uncharacterized protein n=1 Tax=Blattamonas nauphoetae TaxID=2049346 RepID=A0ABQ9YIY0_9EUKA|nr:hypothetical protein BLNAU_1248 [Blattamonas nauphoetae]
MLSSPDPTNASVQVPTSLGPNEWLDKIAILQSESDENKVRLSKEMVVVCLDDCEHKKGTVQKMMEARVLPVLVLELRNELSVELRIAFQVLFDTILLVVSENGMMPLSKHFPTLLALSQDKDSRIAEPVIETIGLISHNLSSRGEVDEFLRSGILEWLVEAVRTHPDGQVRQAIVVGLGEIGFGLKKAVVREKRGESGWKKEGKKSEKEGAARGLDGRGRRDGRAGPRLLGGSVSRADLLVLKSESWVEEDTGGMDLSSRCRRGVRMAGQALVGVLQGWKKRTLDKTGKKKVEQHEEEEEKKEELEEPSEDAEEMEWETDIDVLDIAGSVCGMIFPEVFTISRQEKQGRISLTGEDFEEMKRQLQSELRREGMEREAEKLKMMKDAGIMKSLNAQVVSLQEEARRKDAYREQERQAERAQFQKEKKEMLQLIEELKGTSTLRPSRR